MILRSVLYLPASNARAIEKARSLDCDAVVLDLEDGVAPDRKAEARRAAIGAATEGGFGGRLLVLRVNEIGSEWADEDYRAAAASEFDALLLPKISRSADLAEARARAGGKRLWAMIETCAAMLALPEIAAAARPNDLDCLVVGTNDLAKEMRCTPGPTRAPLLAHLTAIVTAARAHGLVAIDGVCNVIDDPDLLAAECAQGAAFGFDGKTLIHPSQIPVANAAFAPSALQMAWAERVIAAFALPENADKGAIRVDGAMVERLHLIEAKRIAKV
ncbi:MAG: CoA ester lyase [Sphingomonas sp.]